MRAPQEQQPRTGFKPVLFFGSACFVIIAAIVIGTDFRGAGKLSFPGDQLLHRPSKPADTCSTAGPNLADSVASSNQTPTQTDPLQAVATQSVSPQPAQLPGSSLPLEPASSSSCRLQGSLDGCCNCTYQEVDGINERIVYPTLKQLVATPFFRYFKVNLWCDCPLWPDDSMCMMRACSVCTCENHEVPQIWLQQEQANCRARGNEGSGDDKTQGKACNSALCAAESDSVVDRAMEPQMLARLQHLKGWRGLNNPWMAPGEEDEDFLYINLLTNPERYTGYSGEHAHRIWNTIYQQSCFTQLEDCSEKQLFYRLISGMHTSISAHIAANYLLDEEQGLWGPNMDVFRDRLGNPTVRQRVKNLYFAYLFVLRAVSKAAPLLSQYTYDTDMPEEDARTQALIKELLSRAELPSHCFRPFEPGQLFQGDSGPALLEQFQAAFRNITVVMDCVGCEKCKLWGKLQTLGIATALKILFSSPDCGLPSPSLAPLSLERNEVIALVNLLERFAASLHHYQELSERLTVSDPGTAPVVGAADTVQ